MRSTLLLNVVLLGVVIAGGAMPPKKRAAAPMEVAPPPMPPDIAAIQALEDSRSLGEGKLVLYALTSADPSVRKRALLALGCLQAVGDRCMSREGSATPTPARVRRPRSRLGCLGCRGRPFRHSSEVVGCAPR